MKLHDMNVLLTGATGGIGCEIAKQLVEQGASVLLSSHSEDELVSLEKELKTVALSPTQVQICPANLLEAEGIQTITNTVKNTVETSAFPLNVVINNAGMMQFSLFEQQDPAVISRTIQLNTVAPILLIQQLLPLLRKQSESQILNIGSTFGSIGYPGFVSYSTSKAAMQGFSEALKRELADSSIAVKYLSPRATQTALNPASVVAMNKALGNKMDSPELVAEETLKLLTSHQSNKVLGWPEKLFVKVNKLFPSIVDRAIAGQLATIKKFATQQS